MPYQDPTEEWYYKTFFDAGEFGFGQSMVSLEPMHDCPPHAHFMDVHLAATDGKPQKLEKYSVSLNDMAVSLASHRNWNS